MKIRFIGATRTVTGTQHLINVNGYNILLDCGFFQGKREVSFQLNTNFEFYEPKKISALVLSHAHIDHSGNIPQLVRKGFEGKIFSTFATKDLCEVMLEDSAHIIEKDIEFVNKKRLRNNEKPLQPMYSIEDAKNSTKYFYGVKYRTDFEILPDVTLKFYDAGHILGSAIVYLTIKENNKIYKICFSGDLGRPNMAILKDPEIVPTPDILILESTYGGRFHASPLDVENKLEEIISSTIQKNGKIIVPAFSVGRTQELVYSLHNLVKQNRLPKIQIYVDSPLSVNVTEVFRKHEECFDEETMKYILSDEDPFAFNQLHYIKSTEESKKLNDIKKPCMIISASGMCESGRILHHLRNSIENPNNTILIVGYNAEHTLGKRIVEREKVVKIFGEEHELRANVAVMNSFSAHADKNEISDYMKNFEPKELSKIFLVHGDYDQQLKLKSGLEDLSFNNIFIPERGDTFEV